MGLGYEPEHGSGRSSGDARWVRLGGLLGVAMFAGIVLLLPGTDSSGDGTEPGKWIVAVTPTPRVEPAPPRRLRVPSLNLTASVNPIEVGEDRVLRPPRHPELVGWWSGSARPGATAGGTVIAGHTVHTGGGALDELSTLKPGSTVVLRTATATVRYRVEEVRTLSKSELAAAADEVFDTAGPARLVLVTCDDWNGREYMSNVVLFATPYKAVPINGRST